MPGFGASLLAVEHRLLARSAQSDVEATLLRLAQATGISLETFTGIEVERNAGAHSLAHGDNGSPN